MRQRISRVAPFQLGKVFAVLYGLLSIPIVLIMIAAASFGPAGQGMPMLLLLVLPVLYVVFGFIFMALGAWIYNLVAGWTGGIEYDTTEVA